MSPILKKIEEVTAKLNLASCNGPGWPLSEMTVFRIHGEEVTPEAYLAFLEKKLAERKAK